MKFMLNRNRILRSTMGHAIEFVKGELTHVPPAMYAEVIAAGGVPEDEIPEDELPVALTTPESLAEREAAMFVAFDKLTQSNRREDFTAGGAPQTALLAAALGWPVQAKDRDLAWAKYRATKA